MSTSQDSPQKFHEYDSDDRQLLVGLLHEYSEKLVEASREVVRKKGRASKKGELIMFIPVIVLSYALSSLLLKTLVIFIKANEAPAFFTAYKILSDSWSTIVICTTIVSIPAVLSFFVRTNLSTYFDFSNYDRLLKIENDILERDAGLIANRLESAMRLTVEISDRVETNLARKLELDLRIDDASSALDYYYSVINLKSKSQSKSRKVAP